MSHDEPLFSLFPKLPTEIRLLIWEKSRPNRRLVNLELQALRPYSAQERNEDTERPVNHIGNKISNAPYKILEVSSSAPRHLMAVNHEARRALMHVYRIVIPLDASTGRVLRLNPDTDIVSIKTREHMDPHVWYFLSDALAYDPLGQGITHLCLPNTSIEPPYVRWTSGGRDPRLSECIHTVVTKSLKAIYICAIPSSVDLSPTGPAWVHHPNEDGSEEHDGPPWALRDTNLKDLVSAWTVHLHYFLGFRFDMQLVPNIHYYLVDPLYGVFNSPSRPGDALDSGLMESLQHRWATFYKVDFARSRPTWQSTRLARDGLAGVSGLLLIRPRRRAAEPAFIPVSRGRAPRKAVVRYPTSLLDLARMDTELLLLDENYCQL